MKKLFLFAFAISSMLFNTHLPAMAGAGAHEEHMHEHEHHELEEVSEASTASLDIHPAKRENGIIDLNNKVCPVSGKEVNGKNFFEHNGVSYGLCCNMCERDFMKSPEKFALSHEAVEAVLAVPKS